MKVMEIKSVSKTFDEGKKPVKALDNISFHLKRGEILGILGPNGAGKTTLISILCGLLERDEGSISAFGLDFDKDIDKIKPRMNIVTGFSMVNTNLNVKEYLHYFALLYEVKDRGMRINEAVQSVGLSGKEDAIVKDLSSGFKQRLLFAKSLLNCPDLIFMDEPTVGLDVGMAKRIRKLIESLKKRGASVIFTSHNLNEVEQLCDRIALIRDGRIIEEGTIRDIKNKIKNNRMIEVIAKNPNNILSAAKKFKEVNNAKLLCDKIIIEAKSDREVGAIIKKIICSDEIIISIRKIEPTLEEAFLDIMDGN